MSERLIFGTYTRNASEGIYEADLNLETQKIENVDLLANIGDPTYLTTNKEGTVIYSIISENDQGGVVSLIHEGNQWVRRVASMHEGRAACYIAYDEERQFVYTANYHKGTLHVYRTDETGDLEMLDYVVHTGDSVHENQQSPHAHYFDTDPSGEFLVACDLGTDEVYTYSVDTDGKLTEENRLKVKPGTGPRHIEFHPEGDIAYIFGELSSEIIVASYDQKTGEFTVVQTIPTIPATHTDFNAGAALRVTSDGHFLYASNRGHDSIVTFRIIDGGSLELVGFTPTGGQNPRDFNLNESEEYLVVGHQDTDVVSLFKRDTKSGELIVTDTHIEVPEVVCVDFIPVDVVEVDA